jgi:hypothetical protein
MTNDGHVQQWRRCSYCGKASFRTLRWHRQSTLADILKALLSLDTEE